MVNMKILIPPIATALFAIIPGFCQAQSVEQKDYSFKMEITQAVQTKTFVIGDFLPARHPRPPAAFPVGVKNKRQLTLRMSQMQNANQSLTAPILFDLGNSRLPQQEKEKIIMSLSNRVDKQTPLQVTGFTCDLGAQVVNDRLAMQRAEVVAKLLEDSGYYVSSVAGKGREGYISTNPQKRHLNRRVELMVDKSNNQEH